MELAEKIPRKEGGLKIKRTVFVQNPSKDQHLSGKTKFNSPQRRCCKILTHKGVRTRSMLSHGIEGVELQK